MRRRRSAAAHRLWPSLPDGRNSTQLYARLWSITEPRRIVIQRSAVQYLAPIVGEFCATAAAPPHAEWERFLAQLDKRGKSRIAIRVDVLSNGVRAAAFEGDYVAVR
jgi:thioesterase domain-containing protein